MLIDQINLNHLRVFQCVYTNRSMTKAAQELYITQSGVSQHVKQLEDVLQVKLFDRVKHSLIPTEKANQLSQQLGESLWQIEDALRNLTDKEVELDGKIKIGIPIEFGNSVILPLINEFAQKHPKVSFKFNYGFISDMQPMLLDGSLDMAIADDYVLDNALEKTEIYDEVLYLCASEKFIETNEFDRKFFESIPYVKYKDEEAILTQWFKHHYQFKGLKLNIRATLMDVEGMAKLINDGFAAGILPDHMLEKLKSRGQQLKVIDGSDSPLVNKISIVSVKNRTETPAVHELKSFLVNRLAN